MLELVKKRVRNLKIAKPVQLNVKAEIVASSLSVLSHKGTLRISVTLEHSYPADFYQYWYPDQEPSLDQLVSTNNRNPTRTSWFLPILISRPYHTHLQTIKTARFKPTWIFFTISLVNGVNIAQFRLDRCMTVCD